MELAEGIFTNKQKITAGSEKIFTKIVCVEKIKKKF